MPHNEKLKIIREKFDLSQVEMGAKLGITQSYYSAMERGNKDITATIINKLINDFDVSPAWFYNSIGANPFKTAAQKRIEMGIAEFRRFEKNLSEQYPDLFNLYNTLAELPRESEQLYEFMEEININYINLDETGIIKYLNDISKYNIDFIGFSDHLKKFLIEVKPLQKVREIDL